MNFKFLSVLSAVFFLSACHSPTGPSKTDPEWPNPEKDGAKPVPVGQTIEVSSKSGDMTMFIQKMTPAENGTAKVGQKAQVWAEVTNNSSRYLGIRNTVSDGENDRSGQLGTDTNLFSSNGVLIIAPGVKKEVIFGFTVGQPESINYLRLAGNYDTKPGSQGGFQIGPWTKPEWTMDVHLGWNLTP